MSLPVLFIAIYADSGDHSTYLLWISIAHIDAYGPMSTHARTNNDLSKPVTEKPVDEVSLSGSPANGPIAQPGQTHAKPEGFHDRNAGANQQNLSAV
tara:strand:- start:13940 stop:14230 length:291 start_codon:yes stop_codon:yes gene_type:complete